MLVKMTNYVCRLDNSFLVNVFTFLFHINFNSIHTHLPGIVEAITDNVSGGQMTCQAVFNSQVGVKQADHGQLAEIAPTIH